MNSSDIISLSAVMISLGALGWPIFLYFLNRPRLNIFLKNINFRDSKTKKQTPMIQICLINDGFRPVIISQLKWKNDDAGECDYGIFDELKAPYGKFEKVLPLLVHASEMKEINAFYTSSIEQLASITLIDSYDYEIHFDKNMVRKLLSNKILSFERSFWKRLLCQKIWTTKENK